MRMPMHAHVLVVFAAAGILADRALAQRAHWQLNEKTGTTASDISGNANHGTLMNFSTTTSPWIAGKFGFGCSGKLDIAATGTGQYDKVLSLKLTNGTPKVAAFVLVGAPVTPLDLSVAGFSGCVVYPSLVGSKLELSGVILAQLGR